MQREPYTSRFPRRTPSLVQMLDNKTVSALLAKLEEQTSLYYRLYQLSIEPGLGTSWLDTLANAPEVKYADVLVDG
jgi:hypothetical protein